MNTQEILDIETKHSSGTYAKQSLVIVRGQGASLFDADGVEYLDCAAYVRRSFERRLKENNFTPYFFTADENHFTPVAATYIAEYLFGELFHADTLKH